MKTSYDSKLEKLNSEVNALRKDNRHLQQQRQGIVSAVSSIFGLEHQVSNLVEIVVIIVIKSFYETD